VVVVSVGIVWLNLTRTNPLKLLLKLVPASVKENTTFAVFTDTELDSNLGIPFRLLIYLGVIIYPSFLNTINLY
jgi:hypothetical protein